MLANGGFHTSIFGFDRYTHQFDAHGSDSCGGIDHNCGRAGESFYIRNNAFRYTRDDVSDAVSQTVSGLQIGAGNVASGYVDSDARCDVTAGGTVFPGGKPGPLLNLNPNPNPRPGGGFVPR